MAIIFALLNYCWSMTTMRFNSCTLLILSAMLAACSPEAPQHPMNGRFVKLDASGRLLNAKAEQWACVQDTQNGQIWENKSDDEGLRHGTWTYTWVSQALSLRHEQGKQGGSCNHRQLKYCTTESYIQALNAQQHCGQSTWSLPSPEQLQTLLSPADAASGKAICPCLFANTQAREYWTRQYDPQQNRVSTVHFGKQKIGDSPPQNYLYIRAISIPSTEP